MENIKVEQWCSTFLPCGLDESTGPIHGPNPDIEHFCMPLDLAQTLVPDPVVYHPNLTYQPHYTLVHSRVQGHVIQSAGIPIGPEIWQQQGRNWCFHHSPNFWAYREPHWSDDTVPWARSGPQVRGSTLLGQSNIHYQCRIISPIILSLRVFSCSYWNQ